jgi:hypothetical protein
MLLSSRPAADGAAEERFVDVTVGDNDREEVVQVGGGVQGDTPVNETGFQYDQAESGEQASVRGIQPTAM